MEFWSDEDKTRYAYLSILAIVVKGCDSQTKLRKRALMVFDLLKLEGYPWGRLAFKTLMKSVKWAELEGDSITTHGFVQVLQIWMYNLFPNLGRQFGNQSGTESPPLLKFKGTKWYEKRDIDNVLVDNEVNIENAFINKSEPTVWDDDSGDKEIDALAQAICKEGGLGAVTWVEQGLKNVNKKNNTAGKVAVDGGGEAEKGRVDSGQTAGGDCGERNHGEKNRKKMKKTMTEEELLQIFLRGGSEAGGDCGERKGMKPWR